MSASQPVLLTYWTSFQNNLEILEQGPLTAEKGRKQTDATWHEGRRPATQVPPDLPLSSRAQQIKFSSLREIYMGFLSLVHQELVFSEWDQCFRNVPVRIRDVWPELNPDPRIRSLTETRARQRDFGEKVVFKIVSCLKQELRTKKVRRVKLKLRAKKCVVVKTPWLKKCAVFFFWKLWAKTIHVVLKQENFALGSWEFSKFVFQFRCGVLNSCASERLSLSASAIWPEGRKMVWLMIPNHDAPFCDSCPTCFVFTAFLSASAQNDIVTPA